MNVVLRASNLATLGAVVALAACSSSNLGTGSGLDGGSSDGGPIIVGGVPTQHFPSGGAACRDTRPPVNAGSGSGFTCPDAGGGGGAFECCANDSDCTTGNNGRCTITGNAGPHCTYDECATSTDCASGTSCACGDVTSSSYNICVPSNCRTDNDCGVGGYCSPTLGSCGTYGGEYGGVYCHTKQDTCTNDADCSGVNAHCIYDLETSKWACSQVACAG